MPRICLILLSLPVWPVTGQADVATVTGTVAHAAAPAGFPSRPVGWLVDGAALPVGARVTALPDGRHHAATGDLVHVAGVDVSETLAQRHWHAFAAPEPVRDIADGAVLGYQARYLGTLRRLDRPQSATETGGDAGRSGAAIMQVLNAVGEIGPGAVLLPDAGFGEPAGAGTRCRTAATWATSATPATSAHVAAMLAEGSMAGSGHIVVLDAGSRDGLAPGHALTLHRTDVALPGRTGAQADLPPGAGIARVRVLSASAHLAFALVTAARDAVRIGDHAVPSAPGAP